MIFITVVKVEAIKSSCRSYWRGSISPGVNSDRFPLPYSDGLYCFVDRVCPHPASCEQTSRDEASPHCQNFTLEGLVVEGTDFCLFFSFSQTSESSYPFSFFLSFLLLLFLLRIPSYPETNPYRILFFLSDTVVSLRNSPHSISLPMFSSWVLAAT